MDKLLMASLGALCAVFVLEFGGKIEGRLFPVVGPLQLGAAAAAPGGDTVFEGRADKRRSCSYLRTEWYLGHRYAGSVPVVMSFRDPPQVRPTGEIAWTGITLRLAERTARTRSFADVVHKCRFRPWKTRTRFYDPT